MALIPKRVATFFSIPIFRRAAFHVKRLTSGLDSSFFVRIGIVLGSFLLFSAAVVAWSEGFEDDSGKQTIRSFFDKFLESLYWALTTVMGV